MAMPSTSGNPDYFKYSIFQVKSKAPLCAGKRDKAAATSEVFGPVNTLATTLRNRLERAIIDARDGAEAGARAALEACAVHHHEPYGHMSPEQRKLRNHLRARARQLGDRQDRSGNLDITHLVRECAYEQWHRMIFARFLAENNLLIEPKHGVSISLDECQELAQEEATDLWTLAGRFAQRMLPQIFRPDDPILQVAFAPEHKMKLERLLGGLDSEVFRASDSLGWVYQFWQSRRKREVNESGKKIGADELPAVTQLFTEPYMVQFLIHNTLGAWYAGKVLTKKPGLAEKAHSEQELRDAVALEGVTWDYLRFVREQESGPWRPAAGVFHGWPKSAAELKVLDPCCGSGHFLVAVLQHLAPLRMAEEGLTAKDAVDAVIRDNLHGLEIDERCTQIAAFAVAMAAWTFPATPGFRPLPDIRVACSGIAPNATREEWLTLATRAADAVVGETENTLLPDPNRETLWHTQVKAGMEALYELFRQAPVLGSLIDPHAVKGDLFRADFEQLGDLLNDVLSGEENGVDHSVREMSVAAKGVADAVKLLGGRYHLVVTNVPYLGRGGQSQPLRQYLSESYTHAKENLATAFVERCIHSLAQAGSTALVTPQSWLLQRRYKNLRGTILKRHTFRLIARLGPGSFEAISGEVVNVFLMIVDRQLPLDRSDLCSVDVSAVQSAKKKAEAIANGYVVEKHNQRSQLENPDVRICVGFNGDSSLLDTTSISVQGLATSDDPQFVFFFWEITFQDEDWVGLMGNLRVTADYSGRQRALFWQQGKGRYYDHAMSLKKEGRLGGWKSGTEARGRDGVFVSQMSSLPATIFTGEFYDHNGCVIVPNKREILPAVWSFCCTEEYGSAVRQLDSSMKPSNSVFAKVPFNLEKWKSSSTEQFPKDLPEPYSDDPTQWLFHGHPTGSVLWCYQAKRLEIGADRRDATVLHVGVSRLLGYRWPAELDPNMRLSDESRELVKRCEELLPFADKEGIVCIASVRGEETCTERLRALLAEACGDRWSASLQHELLTATGGKAKGLDDWLRNEFFEQHCKLFRHRPFIWHIWDGRKRDGFHALVNYHKLAAPDGGGRKLLENLTYSYLGGWITRQKDGVKNEEGGAEERLIAAEQLQNRLKAILHGEKPYDIFVRWKAIQQQAIGWDPDINDGVRMNIRPFMADDVPGGKKGAGVLRWKPNIKWSKDRGTEPRRKREEYPWFWDGNEFTGDRVNDVHLTLEEKKTARGKAKQ